MNQSMHEKMMRLHAAGEKDGKQPKILTYEVALKGKEQIAEDTYSFTFEKPKGFQFTAGQHIRMTLIDPPETDDEGDSRFWSLASTPRDKDLVIAMRMRDTAFKRVLATLPIGTKVRMQSRQHVHKGAFVLHGDATRPAVFLVGGIGIVPAYSIIKDWAERKLKHKIILLYSNRRPKDAPFLSELQKIAKQNPAFTLVATMTEPQTSDEQWHGETGRIDQSMIKKYVDGIESPIYYVSGLPEMVSAMKTLLDGLGINKDNIQAEEFTGFNLNEIPTAIGSNINKKSRVVTIAIAVGIVALLIVHATGARTLLHFGFTSLSLKNPISYLLIALILVTVVVKFKILLSFKRGRSSHAALKNAHSFIRKGKH